MTEAEVPEEAALESVASFADRARAWLPDFVSRFELTEGDLPGQGGTPAQLQGARAKAIQAAIFEGGFAGVVFPRRYAGLGLTVAHRDALNSEVRAAGAKAVALFNIAGSTLGLGIGMIAPTMLEFGTEDQRLTYIPEMLKGEKLWAQMLSEPTGGSDLAGALTRATRDGGVYIINGSKVWTSQADFSDMAVLLARTDWGAPKHRGLTMFVISLDSPGLTINPLRLVSGGTGFCQEFFDDMPVPAANVLGTENDGWNVASRLLVHERNTVGGGSAFHSMSVGNAGGTGDGWRAASAARNAGAGTVEMAKQVGASSDSYIRQRAAEAHVLSTVRGHLSSRVMKATGIGVLPPAGGSLLRLFGSAVGNATSDTGMSIAGISAVIWPVDGSAPGSGLGVGYLGRQGGSMASGTAEIQRNIISERVLGLPREPSADRELPFDEVRHNAMPGSLSRE